MYRPYLRLVIRRARVNPDEAIKFLEIDLANKKLEEIDGCMNYIITQIIRNQNNISDNEAKFIRGAILKVYVNPLSYFSINRFNGLICSIHDELEERKWRTVENERFLIILKLLFEHT